MKYIPDFFVRVCVSVWVLGLEFVTWDPVSICVRMLVCVFLFGVNKYNEYILIRDGINGMIDY